MKGFLETSLAVAMGLSFVHSLICIVNWLINHVSIKFLP